MILNAGWYKCVGVARDLASVTAIIWVSRVRQPGIATPAIIQVIT